MTKSWQLKFIFIVCLSVGFGLFLSGGAQAQITEITVSDPIIDGTTGGNFVGNYGECFFLFANPNLDRCEEEVGPDSYLTDPDAYRSPSGRNGCFNKNNPDDPVSDHLGSTNVCFGNLTDDLNELPVEFDGFSVADFSVYRVDNAPDQAVTGVTEPDIAFAWSTIAGPNGGQYEFIPCDKSLPLDTDRYTTFDSEFIEDTAVTEIEINQTGTVTLAYYFVNAADVCRVLIFELYVNGVLEKSGTIGDFESGKYLVFEEVAGLTGTTTIRLETSLISDPDSTPTTCGPAAPIPGVNAHISGVFIDNCDQPECSIGDYVWEDANRDGCQDPDESPIEGVEVKLFEDCGDPTEIDSTTTNAEGFYEFTGLDCDKGYRVQFGPAGDIYDYTIADQECVDGDPDESDKEDSDCSQTDGFSGCVTFPDPVNNPDNPTIDCGYVCEGKIGDYVWLDENEDGCQDEVNTGIAGVNVTLSEDCVDRENPQTVQTDADGFYMFEGLCPGEYFVEFEDDGRPNTDPGQVCDADDPDVSDEKDSNCGDEVLQCVQLTKDNPEDPTIDCGKVGPCLELEKRVSGDGGLNYFDADNCSDADVPFTTDDSVYELEVTNCGREAVELDRIIDPDLGINLVLDPVVTIAPNDTVTFTNDAGQTQGLLQKEDACPNPDGEFDNTATVFGSGAGSNQLVEATDPACVKCGPCIDLLKEVSVDGGTTWEDANDPACSDGPGTSDPAEYRLTIENCGGETLVNVVIDDDVLGIDNVPVASTLPVGGTIILTKDDLPALAKDDLCPLTPGDPGVVGNFLRNIAKVDAQGETSGIPVSDEDPACVKCVCIDLVKEVSVDDGVTWSDANDEDCLDGPTTQDPAEYRLIIENCGSVLLTDVVVSDEVLGIAGTDVPDLGVGESIILTKDDIPGLAKEDLCPLTPGDPGVEDSFLRNVAKVDAVGDDVAVSDADPACVKCCPLEVEKEVFPETIECVDSGTDSGTDGDGDECICPCEDSGTDTGTNGEAECIVEKVTYTYTIRNTGDVALLDVTVFDDQLGIIAEFPVLGPGATEIILVEDVCLCEETTNKVTVTANLEDGTLCTAMDEATVTTDLDCTDTGTDGY